MSWKEGNVTPLRGKRAIALTFQAELYESKVKADGRILLSVLVPWQDRHAVAPIADLAGQNLLVEIRAAPEEEPQ
jgi:hypothetical protein